ncbi:MAG: DUF5335 domain-containing protein [bacterium]|nr:DUF5335 domain-containing protein [bacterium]
MNLSMKELEIMRGSWAAFCDRFSRQQRGGLVSVRVLDTAAFTLEPRIDNPAAEIVAQWLPLQGLTLEQTDRGLELQITIGREPPHITHRVRRPIRIFSENDPDGSILGLRVEDADDRTALLVLRAAYRAGTLDGIGDYEI